MNTQIRTRPSPRASPTVAAMRWAVIAALGLAAGLGCSDDSKPVQPVHEHTVATVSVAPSALTLKTGQTTLLSATARCGCGALVESTVSWTSNAPSVASVDEAGTVTGIGFGSAVITATAEGVSATSFLTVEPLGTIVGPSGGTIVSTDGNAVLEIPAGALSAATDITVVKVDDGMFADDPFYVAGTAYQLGPNGLLLQERAHLRIRFDPDQVPDGALHERLRIRERDQDQNQWRETQQNQLRAQEHVVEGDIQRLRIHAVVALDPVGIPVATVEVTPPESSIGMGETVQLSAAILDEQGLPLVRNVHWSTSDGAVATVDGDGLVTATGYGTAVITAAAGGRSGDATVSVVATGTLVGPAGGTVASPDGMLVLEIPEGALDETVDVVVERLQDALFVGNPLYVTGTAWNLEPDRLQLRERATLRIHYDPSNVPAGVSHDRLRLRVRDQDQNLWRAMERHRLRLQEHAVEADIEHFSMYAVIAESEEVPPPVALVTVSPAVVELDPGETLQMTAYVYDADGNLLDTSVTWSSEDPSIATVDGNGLVTGVAEGSTTISAAAGEKKGQGSVNVGSGGPPPASVTVTPATASVPVGGSVQLSAEVLDDDGNVLDVTVTWSSSSTGVATVSSSGLVSGTALGDATITARVKNVSGTAYVTVVPPVSSVVIDEIGNEPLEVGLTVQLNATAYDLGGLPVDADIAWSSSDEGIATVDQDGLVTGRGRGTATITAAVGTASDAVSVRVVGESTEGYGNNLSWPVIFADGIGITGVAVTDDPGIRPLATEEAVVDALPFFWEGNVPNYAGVYYEQQSSNTWAAVWEDGTGQPEYETQIYWGDNLTHQTWSASRPIRVEQALYATAIGTRTGYSMTYLYGEGPEEMQGTDGSTAEFIPLIYTVGPQLIVEKLSGAGGSVVATVVDEAAGSEVNVGGRVIYGYNLQLKNWTPPSGVTKDGWYRLTFAIANGANVALSSVGNEGDDLLYLPEVNAQRNLSTLEIYIEP